MERSKFTFIVAVLCYLYECKHLRVKLCAEKGNMIYKEKVVLLLAPLAAVAPIKRNRASMKAVL